MIKRPREKNDKHLAFIRGLPCCIPGCGNNIETEAAHVRSGSLSYGKYPPGQAKPSDCWTLPLCGKHHREQHSGNELTFWVRHGIDDPFHLCCKLFMVSGDHAAGEQILSLNK